MANLSNINNKFLVTTGGNVGIGVTSPGAKLDVNGDVYVRETGALYVNTLAGYTSNVITLNSNTNFIVPSGNVGIGVAAHGTASLNITNTDQHIRLNNGSELGVISLDTDGKLDLWAHGTDETINFRTGTGSGTVTMSVVGGNVGIGNTNPLAVLSIGSGSLTDANIPVQISTSGGTSQRWFGVNKDGNYGLLMGYLNGGSIGDAGAGAYIRNIAEDPLYFMVSNSDLAMTITSNKNVGIGTASPGQKLEVYQAATNSQAYVTVQNNRSRNAAVLTQTTNGGFYTGTSIGTDTLCWQVYDASAGERMRIDSSGNSTFAKNISVTDGTLTLNKSDGSLVKFVYNNTTRGYIGSSRQLFVGGLEADMGYLAIGDSVFGAGGVERMRITSGGNLLFGITNEASQPTNKNFFIADFQSGASVIIGGHSGTHTAVQFRHNGSTTPGSIVITTNTTTYNTSSDYRLKEDLQDFTGLDMVYKIPVYDFKWKTDESRSYGVMAHELQKVLPDAVTGEKDAEEMQGVDYSKIVPLLVKSIQELKAEIELLKSK